MPAAGWDTATKSGSPASQPGTWEGSVEAQPQPCMCHGAPRAGLGERGWLVPLWGQHMLGVGNISSLWWPGPPGLCKCSHLWVAILHHQRAEECFLDHRHRASWARTMRREHRPSSVVNRLPLSGNAVLCWKFCHVFHKLLRDGHSNVSAQSSAWGQILSPAGLHRVMGDAGESVSFWGVSPGMRTGAGALPEGRWPPRGQS